LHVVPDYPGATIVADLTDAPHIPAESFDCIILTQTIHYIFDIHVAVATLKRRLKPVGALLLTVPCINQAGRGQLDSESDCWRFAALSVRKVLACHFHGARLFVRTYGNVLAATSFLYGKAACELTQRELDHHDPDYPVTIAAVVVKEGKPA